MGRQAEAQLQKAIRDLYGCEAVFVEAVPVSETLEGQDVWEGVVYVFDLQGHPTATRCYAWAHLVRGVSGRQKMFAVLHQPPVDSPVAAVRASILQQHRRKRRRGSSRSA